MKNPAGTVFKFAVIGMMWGCTSFVAMMFCFYLAGAHSVLLAIIEDFASQTVGALIVGIACTMPAILYRMPRPGMPYSALIHYAVGVGFFLPVAYHLHWIPFKPGQPRILLIQLLLATAIFFVSWSVFFLINRREALSINARVRELEQEQHEQQ